MHMRVGASVSVLICERTGDVYMNVYACTYERICMDVYE